MMDETESQVNPGIGKKCSDGGLPNFQDNWAEKFTYATQKEKTE